MNYPSSLSLDFNFEKLGIMIFAVDVSDDRRLHLRNIQRLGDVLIHPRISRLLHILCKVVFCQKDWDR